MPNFFEELLQENGDTYVNRRNKADDRQRAGEQQCKSEMIAKDYRAYSQSLLSYQEKKKSISAKLQKLCLNCVNGGDRESLNSFLILNSLTSP